MPKISVGGVVLDNGVKKVLTGQQVGVNLEAGSTPPVLPITPGKLANGGWVIKGLGVFKSYPFMAEVCQIKRLTVGDRYSPIVQFFTFLSEDIQINLRVVLNTTLDPNAKFVLPLPNINLSEVVTSVHPTISDGTIFSGFVNPTTVTSDSGSFGYSNPNDGSRPAGQTWLNVRIDVPSPFVAGPGSYSGQGCFAQTVTYNRTITRLLNTNAPSGAPTAYVYPYQGLPGLDVSFPFPFGGGTPTGEYPVGGYSGTLQGYSWWVGRFMGAAIDIPKQPLNAPNDDGATDHWVHSDANDQMTTWVMYQPPSYNGQQVTWVPLAQYSWGWENPFLSHCCTFTEPFV